MGKLKSAAKICVSLVDRGFSAADPLLSARPSRNVPAIFIIGGPRSGSTLVYQALIYCRRFAYLNNFVSCFPRSAAVIARMLAVNRWPIPHEFISNYGETKGLNAPSEAGDFWDYIFPWTDHHAMETEDFDPQRVHKLRRVVSTLVSLYKAPFLCKNLWHSVRISALDVAFPKALFILIERSPLLMSQSMLVGRRRVLGEATGFWSIRPIEAPRLKYLPTVDHVAYQLAFTYQAIARARARLGAHRFFHLPYESFCEAPQLWVERIDQFLGKQGIRVESRGRLDGSFKSHRDINLADAERARLEEIFRQEWPRGDSSDWPMTADGR